MIDKKDTEAQISIVRRMSTIWTPLLAFFPSFALNLQTKLLKAQGGFTIDGSCCFTTYVVQTFLLNKNWQCECYQSALVLLCESVANRISQLRTELKDDCVKC